jgi:hypothetical protein
LAYTEIIVLWSWNLVLVYLVFADSCEELSERAVERERETI